MKYFRIKATLKKDGLIGDEVDTAEGRKKLYAKVHRIKEKLGKGRLLFLVRKQYYSNLLIRYFFQRKTPENDSRVRRLH